MLKFKIADYSNPRQAPALKACLSAWFNNPKDLNLTAPQMSYPFRYNQWVNNFRSYSPADSFILLDDNWIIAHIGLRYYQESRRAHILHLIVAPDQRRKGYARLLVEKVEQAAVEKDYRTISLYVNHGNQPAYNLYSELGYTEVKEKNKPHIRMEKELMTIP